MVVDYLSSQPNRAGYQVSTKKGSGPIQGRIYDKWQSMGAQNSELGYPISDELTTPDGVWTLQRLRTRNDLLDIE